jgi:hypothetical protein
MATIYDPRTQPPKREAEPALGSHSPSSQGNSNGRYVYTPLKPGEIRLLEILPGGPYSSEFWCLSRLRTARDEHQRLLVLAQARGPFSRKAEDAIEAITTTYRDAVKSLWPSRPDLLQGNMAAFEYARVMEVFWNEAAREVGLPRLDQKRHLLWIDGVCIDQNNCSERSDQVKLMAQIYETSTRLVTWLGPDPIFSDCLSYDVSSGSECKPWFCNGWRSVTISGIVWDEIRAVFSLSKFREGKYDHDLIADIIRTFRRTQAEPIPPVDLLGLFGFKPNMDF